MRFTSAIAAAILAFTATGVLAAPLPQLAGEGSAADSILTDTDNGVGFGIENAEDNIADNIAQIKGSVPATPALLRVRQLAGEGAAANSILSDTENGVGFGIENAEDNIAGNIAQVKGSVPATLAKRQLDKIANVRLRTGTPLACLRLLLTLIPFALDRELERLAMLLALVL
jgi:hypothetical protein